jgi:CDP-diacylglycerol---serine O-phosphatidyltransferase
VSGLPAPPSAGSGSLLPSRPARGKQRFRRGAAILPSLFTTGNLFLGFWAIVRAVDGRYADAAPLIGGAIVLDVLDGRIARLTGTTSEFGGELDSLADAISFGVAPALMAYRWALDQVPRLGWLAAFLFVMCGVLRLARFNVQRHAVDGRFFVGLPVPAAAAQVATVIAIAPLHAADRTQGLLATALVVCVAFLMVSTIRYRSFKGVDLRTRRSYTSVLGIALLFVFIAAHLEYSLLVLASAYTLSGPGAYLLGLLFRRRTVAPPPVAAGEAR